ncbi:MAG: hypothetical protein IPJ04_12225 [Candidatus Eisenbacteria bacterium]|nr:hypothetical protein [Candidatus Eisenbacteria bacterium]
MDVVERRLASRVRPHPECRAPLPCAGRFDGDARAHEPHEHHRRAIHEPSEPARHHQRRGLPHHLLRRLQAAATSLAVARRTRLPLATTGPFLATTIPVSALFDQFSGGRTDPAAIRNFLRAAFYNWSTRPTFVTLLGDASYDFKDLSGRAPAGQPGTLVPTYENGFDDNYRLKRQFATDDWLLNVDAASSTLFIPEFFGGRLPANDAATALDVVRRKVLLYETSAPYGEYRNDVMLIADNDLQGENCDILDWRTSQTDELNRHHIPLHIDRDYVYLHTYPSGPGGSRPGAREEIRSTSIAASRCSTTSATAVRSRSRTRACSSTRTPARSRTACACRCSSRRRATSASSTIRPCRASASSS